MEIISLEYLAGILDGEGCVLVSRCKKSIPEYKRGYVFRAHMTIANTHIPLLEKIQAQYGGRIRKEGELATFALSFNTSEIRDLLPKLLQFLIVKKTQAEILLDFLQKMESNKTLPVSNELFSFYESCYWKLRDLKKIRYSYKSTVSHIIGMKICDQCKKEFPIYSKHHYKKFCSRKCRQHARWIRSNATQRTRRLLGSDVPNSILNN